jgi:hypothetical protein
LSFAFNDSEKRLEGFKICPRDVSAAWFHSASILSTVSPGTDYSNFSFVS